jgi:hypothetical protein
LKILLTFDYELFFGSDTGTVQRCMIEPTRRLLEIFRRHNCRVTFFVDAGCVLNLSRVAEHDEQAREDYDQIVLQLNEIAKEGHDIQLHVHPQWEDAVYENGKWNIPAERFRLHDFSSSERVEICNRYAEALRPFAKNTINVFRAGGWCLQPFDEIKESLESTGIKVDSSVFSGGYNSSSKLYYDYRRAPQKSCYRFSSDPLHEESDGQFLEMPISDILVSPFFYWNYAYRKYRGREEHQTFGDGSTVQSSFKHLARLLTRCSHSVVSCDGFKSKLLQKALNRQQWKFGTVGNFVVIGHPKAATEFSLKHLEKFIALNRDHEFIPFSEHPAVKDD